MVKEFVPVVEGISTLIEPCLQKLRAQNVETFYAKKNSQGRTIKQIVGHMIDSASNNTHRIIHLQYRESPVYFPNYATHGNNDKWISIQNYQDEEWQRLLELWKWQHLHTLHVIRNIDESKLDSIWRDDDDNLYNLKDMVIDFLRHFKLHLAEIEDIVSS